jgi:tRNA pseudouridine55 synthase
MNRLFVAYKQANQTSSRCLSALKRKYGVKKAGFSGILDPFAKGVLVVAFGQYTKLFRFLSKSPKKYRATLWLGANSPTLDSEGITHVQTMMPFHPDSLKLIFDQLVGEHTYTPPSFSAKKIDGKRAYALARSGQEVELEPIKMDIYEASLVHYCHPFITFDVNVSEGAYVRSIGQMISQKLGFCGSLSALERLNEGRFYFENEKALDPLEYIDLPRNEYLGLDDDISLGRKLDSQSFTCKQLGTYVLEYPHFFSIIEITPEGVVYHLNRMERC